MLLGKFHGLRIASCGLVFGGLVSAENFVAPAEGPVAFRRDKVPLNSERMVSLAKDLVTLAESQATHTAAERRGAAQMLALAIALNPANPRARELIGEFSKSAHPPHLNPKRLTTSREQIWQVLAWLETPAAGRQGQALAACLTDVIFASDPQHPQAEAWREAGERGAWTSWVEPVSAFEAKVVEKTSDESPAP